jgi:hydrogenase maturation protein HypF
MKQPVVVQHSIELPFKGPPVLATGSYFRNALCITSGDRAYLTSPLGDLDTAAICTDHEVAATEVMVWQGTIPAVIARGLDPDVHSSRFAIELAGNLGVPNLAVQHHHAHVAAVCAEHALMEPVVGLVLDDRGMGSDGACWGGELLRVDGANFERLGHLLPLVKPGGDIALRETWRLAAGVLHHLQRTGEIRTRFREYPASADLVTMLTEGRNCPPTSSAGLLIVAAANLLRLNIPNNLHAGAMMVLEEAAVRYFRGNYAPIKEGLWRIDSEGRLDLYPLLSNLADEENVEKGAATLHANLIAGAAEWTANACAATKTRVVVLAGAAMCNYLLATGLRDTLEMRGLTVFEATKLLPDDSSIALGQAWVALRSELQN